MSEVEVEEAVEELETAEDETTEEPEVDAAKERKRLKRRLQRKQAAMKFADEATYVGGWAVAVIALFILLQAFVPITLGLKSTVIATGSMTGYANAGDVLISYGYQGQKLTVGQPVIVRTSSGYEYFHRIVEVNENGAYTAEGNGTYTTRGDANNANDLFKPTTSDIVGLPLSVVQGFHAELIRLFIVDATWWNYFSTAVTSGNAEASWNLLPGAPWALIALAFSAILLWIVLPKILRNIVNRANLRESMTIAGLATSLEAQGQSIEAHEESISEIEPVVEEIVHEREVAKAEKEEANRIQEEAWGKWDPLAPIYDEYDGFEDANTSEDEEALPTLPKADHDFDVNSFMAEVRARHTPTRAHTSDSLRTSLPNVDTTSVAPASESRSQASAFYLED